MICWTPMKTAVLCSVMLNQRCVIINRRQLWNPYFLPRRLISEEKKEKNLRRTKEDEGRIPGKRSTVGEPGGQKPIVR